MFHIALNEAAWVQTTSASQLSPAQVLTVPGTITYKKAP
jgi:hypothetical protein